MNPVIYVTREIERALGLTPNERYRIVTNRTPYGETIKRQYPEFVTLIDGNGADLLGTGDLLERPETAAVFERAAETAHASSSSPRLLVFKNTARIEPIAIAHGWTLLNPPAAVSEKIENKISQVAWLGELTSYLPAHQITTAKDIAWNGKPFIVQWAHGHTGGGTTLIESAEALAALKTTFPERRARISDYIVGPSFTVNVAVTPETIAPGNVSYQITGMKPFTDMKFATVGNDWGATAKILSAAEMAAVGDMIRALGARMQKDSWRGLFGIDLIKDQATGRIYLIEINARQPASAPFESALQEAQRAADGGAKNAPGMTIFEAHIAALLGQPLTGPIIPIDDGAQIVQRVTATVKSVPEDAAGSLELAGYTVVTYPNTVLNADLLRIQGTEGIMAAHDTFNARGTDIMDMLTPSL